ncbi:hypothetical protein B4U80_13366 [Leptotrombidium deliense]|uniref:Lipase domain-containing protein n=1 Tax=Leptotrombidium deliense TaxID=299467 RepID=A0A443S7K9_9ACAR|nr:hypothetical protein B4U80_13366 [Leptotrombidium deliense]
MITDYLKNGDCQPVAYNCSSYDDFLRGKCVSCENNQCELAAYHVQVSKENHFEQKTNPPYNNLKMYLKTAALEPFCLYHYQVVVASDQVITCDTIRVILKENEKEFSVIVKKDDTQNTITSLMTIDPKETNYTTPSFDSVSIGAKLFTTNCLEQISYIEINYLSNIDERIRKEKSMKFCLDKDNRKFFQCARN